LSRKKEAYTYDECFEQVRTMARLFGLMFYHFSNLAVEEMRARHKYHLKPTHTQKAALEEQLHLCR